MSNDSPNFTIKQDLDIVQPQSTSAIPITIQEWVLLKQSINNISDSNSIFHTIGSALIGAGLSTLIAAIFTPFQPDQETREIIMYAVAIVCLISGGLSCFFAHKEKGITKKSAQQVLAQMQVVENKYGIEKLTCEKT